MQRKIAFMGTPVFAVPILKHIYQNGYEVSAVYTQPPKKSKRGQKIEKSPIHLISETLSLNVRTPDKLRENNLEPQYAMTPSVPENLLPNLEEAEIELSIEKSAIAKMNKQNENLIESFDQVDLSTTTTTSSAIASLPKNEDKSFINQNITLKF